MFKWFMLLTGDGKGLSPTQPHEILPPKFSGPFLPGLDVGPWSPPVTQHQGWSFQQQSVSAVEERLVLADAKIQQLTMENRRLRQFIVNGNLDKPAANSTLSKVNNYKNQQTNTRPTSTLLEMKDSLSDSTMSNSSLTQGLQDITNTFGANPFADENSSTQKSVYSAPHVVVQSVVQGTFNFATMPTHLIRAIVWTLAYCQPKNNHESTGLKTAVKALTARFGVSDTSEPSTILTKSIIDWAKPLCYTSCGNYLCQQLLERGTLEDRKSFLNQISDDIVPIASNKFGTHVLCKAINLKELEEPVAGALFRYGVYESMQTGARRLWREYLEKCRQARNSDIFQKVNREMVGRWADLACANEILEDIAHISNNQFGHFAITKLVSYPNFYKQTCEAIINSYPPVATTHHGVNLAKIALTEGGRASFIKYVEAICRQDDGRTPGIVTIATSSIGKAHLTFLMSCLTPSEHVRVRSTCRAYSTSLRNCQSGNDLLRALGIMHSTSAKHRNTGINNV
ncbi:hypothetical protein CNBC4070 [Cryptococcus deneoformans B-3501A]|uniref:hypothetical protein n=1 Tax=Cryptococcus deneoformans (strain B-3501A) TaxID=283643 RepID=UPI000042C6D6|nr:hypothetical protein CNBC4070 [Cryptococcus neoformans var. neoformans B-3501A]EAL22269.1 hypothetical protein CNBC4070 [Cryptococcus neoformans var. neoformans B-3501A]